MILVLNNRCFDVTRLLTIYKVQYTNGILCAVLLTFNICDIIPKIIKSITLTILMLSSPDTKNNIAIQEKSMAHNHPIDPSEFFVNFI